MFLGSSISSDALVSEAAGGESAAISLKESDEKGFWESEVCVCFFFLLIWYFYMLINDAYLSVNRKGRSVFNLLKAFFNEILRSIDEYIRIWLIVILKYFCRLKY